MTALTLIRTEPGSYFVPISHYNKQSLTKCNLCKTMRYLT
nr:MAG TPA: hypothetical protein [Herelleviridae sp.]